jgi:ClpA/ClpB-like protein
VFEHFTEGARRVVALAQEEARALRHGYIGTEHLLLGVLAEESLPARALQALGVEKDPVRDVVLRIVGRGPDDVRGKIPFTPRATWVIERSGNEALTLGHNYIGSEHLLLGLLRQEDGVAARVLVEMAIGSEAVRAAVLGLLRGPAVVPTRPARPIPPEGVDWPAALMAAIAVPASARSASVRITLADGERFLVESFEPVESEGLLGLAAYPDADEEMIPVEGGDPRTPRVVIVRPEAVVRAEVLQQSSDGRERGFHGLRSSGPG